MPTPKEIIEGKPVGCPLHPLLVHLPIALLPLGVVLDVASWIWARPEWLLVRAAFVAIAAGVVTGILASLAGVVDYTSIRNDHPAKKTATAHMLLNVVAIGLFAASLGLRYGSLDLGRTALLPLAISVVGLLLLGYSGYLGGKLVYDDGIGVGRHHRDTPLPENTIERPAASDGQPVEIGAAPLVREGETARVSIGGTVAAVARADGRLCAFQEFCTHRYAPLSEGKTENGEVVCPWHGSRFAMATGKVTKGPAKEDLRTFPIEEREGKVRIRVEGS